MKCLGADKLRAGIVSISCVILQVLLTPVPVEGFCWFCGSMAYTFLYSLAWLLVALLLLLANNRERTMKSLIPLEIGILFLSFAVARGNYVVALLRIVFFDVWMFLRKHPQRILSLCNGGSFSQHSW